MGTAYTCRSCGAQSTNVLLHLGNQPLANNLLKPSDLERDEPRFPLQLFVCPSCWLLQITNLVPPVDLFSEYLYFSSFSDAMLRHAKSAVDRYCEEYQLGTESYVVEVASNDGYLLKNFVEKKIPCLGIEPAANIAEKAKEVGVESLVDFFGKSLAKQLAEENKSCDLILGNNVFAHAPDTNDFVAGLATLLKPNGRIILEFPYGVPFIEKTEFDTIYHEHVFYFTLTALLPLFARHNLDIFDVEQLTIHGGSLRLFACHQEAYPRNTTVDKLLDSEKEKGVDTPSFYEGFVDSVQTIKRDLTQLLQKLKDEGKSIAAYGASAKGSTLLNFVNLEPGILDFVTDRSTYKQGMLTPGTHIPIVPPEALIEKMPDYTLLLTWNFKDEILAQQQEYRDKGGKFIVPIPKVEIV